MQQQQYPPQQPGAFYPQIGYQTRDIAPAAGQAQGGQQAPMELHGYSRQSQVYEAP